MIYKVLEMGTGTGKTGKSYKKLKLEGTDGEHSVYIFSDFPHYAEITFGSEIDGEIKKNDKGYDNLYSNEIKRSTTPRSPSQRDVSKDVEEAQKRTQEGVKQAQEFTSASVRVSATMRDAVILATTEFKDKTVLDNLDEAVLKWRKWLWKHWDDPITDPIYPN